MSGRDGVWDEAGPVAGRRAALWRCCCFCLCRGAGGPRVQAALSSLEQLRRVPVDVLAIVSSFAVIRLGARVRCMYARCMCTCTAFSVSACVDKCVDKCAPRRARARAPRHTASCLVTFFTLTRVYACPLGQTFRCEWPFFGEWDLSASSADDITLRFVPTGACMRAVPGVYVMHTYTWVNARHAGAPVHARQRLV